MFVKTTGEEPIHEVVIRALGFPALLGGLMLGFLVIDRIQGSELGMLPSDVIGCVVFTLLASIPFECFSLLSWWSRRSRRAIK